MIKLTFLLIISLLPFLAQGQPDFENLQNEWVQALKTAQSASDFYWEEKNFTFAKIDSVHATHMIQRIRSEQLTGLKNYRQEQIFKHDDHRFISVGVLETERKDLLLLTGWRNVNSSWKKEIDVLLSLNSNSANVEENLQSVLQKERRKWVDLANQHDPDEHIAASYTQDASYFGNGRKSKGRAEIAERYFYMENPNYQVDLEKEHLWNISDINVLEVGRYFTGTERVGPGGLYVILWEKQNEGDWLIELDFNF